ncbi:MAG: hypothetical protein WC823_07580 [Parcubacteria group bacterium]|jgi:hypothetical protein
MNLSDEQQKALVVIALLGGNVLSIDIDSLLLLRGSLNSLVREKYLSQAEVAHWLGEVADYTITTEGWEIVEKIKHAVVDNLQHATINKTPFL